MKRLPRTGQARPSLVSPRSWNQVIDSVNEIGGRPKPSERKRQRKLVEIINDTGLPLDIGQPVTLGPSVDDPTLFTDEFVERLSHVIEAPDFGDEERPFGITQGAIDDQESGVALVSGYGIARVEILDATHRYAVFGDHLATELESSPSARHGVEIVHKSGAGLGVMFCRVRIGIPHPQLSKIGVTAGIITAGSSGTINIWRDGAVTSPLETEVAELDWMHGGQDISAGKEVLIQYFADEDLWRIVGAECED